MTHQTHERAHKAFGCFLFGGMIVFLWLVIVWCIWMIADIGGY